MLDKFSYGQIWILNNHGKSKLGQLNLTKFYSIKKKYDTLLNLQVAKEIIMKKNDLVMHFSSLMVLHYDPQLEK